MKEYHLKMFREDSKDNDWRWNMKAANGRVVACIEEGKRNRKYVVSTINLIFPWLKWKDEYNAYGIPPARKL